MASSVFILTDEPLERDRRVIQSIAEYPNTQIVFIQDHKSISDYRVYVIALWLMLRALFGALPMLKNLIGLRKQYSKQWFWSGVPAAWRSLCRAVNMGQNMKGAEFVHAHDLYCAVAALLIAPRVHSFIYDSHEVQFHRNRKSGILRALIEVGLEKQILQAADEVRIVNYAIADLMRKLYRNMPPVRVLYNDFYASHELAAPPAESHAALVYVGKGLSGRMLEVLDRPRQELGAEVFLFHLGASVPKHISGQDWHIGPVDYEAALIQIAQSRRCLMWCCHDDICLSYKYAIPNKFFQALALGMPVVALHGTYLAEIVDEFELGPVYKKGESLGPILQLVGSGLFEHWRANGVKFLENIRSGELKI
jgi:hypothetical protein